jgi:hypothetical protein
MKSFKKIIAMDYGSSAQMDAADDYMNRFIPALIKYQDAGVFEAEFSSAYRKITFTDAGHQALVRYRWRLQEAEDLAARRII